MVAMSLATCNYICAMIPWEERQHQMKLEWARGETGEPVRWRRLPCCLKFFFSESGNTLGRVGGGNIEANKLKDSILLYVLPLEIEEWNYNYLHTDCFISTFIREFYSSPLHLSRSTYLPAGQMYFIKCNDLIQSTWPWVAYIYYPYILLTWHKLDELRWTVLFQKELVLSL